MTWGTLLAYCLAKPGAWPDEPWEGDVVAKVGGKIFAFFGSGDTPSVGLKCGASREAADEWLLRYPEDASVMAYIGRSGWNTLRIGGAIPDDELLDVAEKGRLADPKVLDAQVARLLADPLGVGQVAGIVIRHLERHGFSFRARLQSGEELGHIAAAAGKLRRPLAVLRVVAQQVSVILHVGAATGGVDDNGVSA